MSTTRASSIALATAFILTVSPVTAAEKTRIDSLEELPPHTYTVPGTVLELVDDPIGLARLQGQVRRDIEADLAAYEITDTSTLQRLHKTLLRLDLLEGDFKAAAAELDRISELEGKRSPGLTSCLIARVFLDVTTRRAAGSLESTATDEFSASLDRAIVGLPWPEVSGRLGEIKAEAEIVSRELLRGLMETRIQPAVDSSGVLSTDLAARLIHLLYLAEIELPLNPVIVEVIGDHISRNRAPMVDYWATRGLSLSPEDITEPVVIGIWDAGVDVTVFPNQLWTNGKESPNGLDDDGNGHVDDFHGIAFNLEGEPSTGLLLPLGDQADDVKAVMEFVEGFWDLVAAIESPAATAARKRISTIPASEVGGFINALSLTSHYFHGTHVAGIAVADNPGARILVLRTTFDHSDPPLPLMPPAARKLAASFTDSINYLVANGARVVNMSWGVDHRMIESGLEAGGVGSSAEERAELAGQILAILRDALRNAMAATPQILYVTAAGNIDGDVDFDRVIPSSFVLPNLAVVGALDRSGNPTGFTSFGRNVRLYANGYQVESVVPGGERIKGSGTSMAAPAVANLAAKLIARNPALTPAQTISLMEGGADPHPENPGILRMNPMKTWELSMKLASLTTSGCAPDQQPQ
jgi:subtilisin family serine protease